MSETQICTKCKIDKSLNDFVFEKAKNRYRKQCRVCRNLAAKLLRDNKRAEKEKAKALLPPPVSITEKQCTKCLVTKPLEDYFNSGRPGCKDSMCKPCKNEYQKNRAKIIPKKHVIKEDLVSYQKCNFCNEDKPIEGFLRHDNGTRRKECSDCRRIRAKKHRENILSDPEKKKSYNENKQLAARKLLEKYPEKKLMRACRKRIYMVLKSNKSYDELIGCESNFLKRWFDFHFKIDSGLNFDNHASEWHIDHVLPCNIFDINNEEHKKQCFHWSNITPLKIAENLRKGDKICVKSINEQNKRLKEFCLQENISVIQISIPNLRDTSIAGTPLEVSTTTPKSKDLKDTQGNDLEHSKNVEDLEIRIEDLTLDA